MMEQHAVPFKPTKNPLWHLRVDELLELELWLELELELWLELELELLDGFNTCHETLKPLCVQLKSLVNWMYMLPVSVDARVGPMDREGASLVRSMLG